MVADRGGHFNPAGIDGVHTCLYYYRPVQHMTLPRVIQYNTYKTENIRMWVKHMTKTGEYELRSPVSNA